MFGPIILFWYVDWYWVFGYYNLYFTYTSYVLYKGYDNNPKYRKKYPLSVVIILPLLLGFIGLIISVVNGFEEIREGDKDFNKSQSKTKNQRVSDKTTTKDKVNIKEGDEKIEYFPSGEIKIKRVWINDIKSEEYEYDLDGTLVCEYKNQKGEIKQTNYYSNGNIRFEVKKNSFKENDIYSKNIHEYKSYWLNGNLMCESNFNYDPFNRFFPKTNVIEEKFLENGEPLSFNNEDSSDSNYYSSGERKETEDIKNIEGDVNQKVVTSYFKNGKTKY